MELLEEPIAGLKILRATKKGDQRGYFVELYKSSLFERVGLPNQYVQLNESQSIGCVRRGLHFQWDPPMAKVARVSRGSARLVALDLRIDSPDFGKSHFVDLSEDDSLWYYAEYGFARGFETEGGTTNLEYLVTGEYNSNGEGGVSSFDESLVKCWKVNSPIISERDMKLPSITDWKNMPESNLLRMQR